MDQRVEDRAWVYFGSASASELLAGSVAATSLGRLRHVAWRAAGDVNGDGYSDVILGPRPTSAARRTRDARTSSTASAYRARCPISLDRGERTPGVRRIGLLGRHGRDVNGGRVRGRDRGARFYDNGQTDEGRAYVYFGSAAGLAATAAWTAESDQDGASFGWSVAPAGTSTGTGTRT